MNTLLIKIKGMHCENCEKRIQNALTLIDGVVSVSANHQTGEVHIKINSEKIDKEFIYKKLEDMGFEVINK